MANIVISGIAFIFVRDAMLSQSTLPPHHPPNMVQAALSWIMTSTALTFGLGQSSLTDIGSMHIWW